MKKAGSRGGPKPSQQITDQIARLGDWRGKTLARLRKVILGLAIDNLFTDQLLAWQIFYSTVALACTTLAGLLFVSLSIHKEKLQGRSDGHSLRLARGSCGDFLYVLMIGLVFPVPHQSPIGLAITLFVLGGSRGIGLTRQAIRSAA